MSKERVHRDFTGGPLCLSGRGVTKVFGLGEKTVAVDHVDFDFHEGEFVSIVGESGSGKTTLSKMLLGLLTPSEGEILFQGKPRDIGSARKKREYWKGIQAIFQGPRYWPCLLHLRHRLYHGTREICGIRQGRRGDPSPAGGLYQTPHQRRTEDPQGVGSVHCGSQIGIKTKGL